MLVIRTKQNIRIFGVNPLSYETTLKRQLNGQNWDAELGHLSAFDWAMLCSWPVLGRMLAWKWMIVTSKVFLRQSEHATPCPISKRRCVHHGHTRTLEIVVCSLSCYPSLTKLSLETENKMEYFKTNSVSMIFLRYLPAVGQNLSSEG